MQGTGLAQNRDAVTDQLERSFAIFRRLIVLLDDGAPLQGAFAHALEWAWHLRLPIHAWALSFPGPASEEFAAKVNACAKVCGDWGVELRLTPMDGESVLRFRQQLRPEDLLIVSYAPTVPERLALIRQVLQEPAAVLICPQAWKSSLSHMLFLYRGCDQNQEALATVMDLCRCLQTTPVVLTVAGSQREGSRLQQPVRAAFADHRQEANFDLLIGAEVAEAAARVARWRHCQLLVMGCYGRPPWARWFGGSTTERLIGLADSLAVLTIPKRDTSAVPPDSSETLGGLGEIFRLRARGRTHRRKVGGT
jgi:nucleotide-binding universal stress UspA family protein